MKKDRIRIVYCAIICNFVHAEANEQKFEEVNEQKLEEVNKQARGS